MNKYIFSLLLLTITALGACNSDRTNDASNDSNLRDTSVLDTSSVDSINAVDSAVGTDTLTDSAGVGHAPAPQP